MQKKYTDNQVTILLSVAFIDGLRLRKELISIRALEKPSKASMYHTESWSKRLNNEN